ncbi:MAG: glycosyltransferase family 2 protein [Proteobacteria bacterium]|nr:glycosyltransferase family 2 protein [Cystobacterineae bacterium]MCL2258559.1 glycosyltransferase family 2 protein [Cystobacterineae bacterium]MCL2315136.1 glycosyltransferase family 2 protein [Pseudomonadota bacterium]
MERSIPCLALVIPCYNEEAGLPHVMGTLDGLLVSLKRDGLLRDDSFVLYVDDGSRDGTWRMIEERNLHNPHSRGLKLAGNVGHQNALLAGMLEIRDEVDCLISMDADLQDDIHVIPVMLERYAEGCEIVYGVRKDRRSDTLFKRCTAGFFYGLMKQIGVRVVPQHADYRLVSRIVLEALAQYGETNLFLRGIFPSMGFSSAVVAYERKERQHGKSKYPLRRMLAFAWQGITSFSGLPLRLAGLCSLSALLLALLLSLLSLLTWARGETVSGWASLMIAVLFLGSVQLFCITLIGEYLAKIYAEVKRRPRYIVEKKR